MARQRAPIIAGIVGLLVLTSTAAAQTDDTLEHDPPEGPAGEESEPERDESNEPDGDDPERDEPERDEPDDDEPDGDEPEDDDGGERGEVEHHGGEGTPRYVLERVVVRGNTRTDTGTIRSYVPLRDGEALEVDDPRIEATRWRLLGTGWFEDVELGLERGARRGHVLFVVEVRERNTFVVQGVALGFSEGVLNSDDPGARLEPYFGISLAEQNLFGTGIGLEATALLSMPQQGVRVRAGIASLAGSDWGLTGAVFFNEGREFFGDEVVIASRECPPGAEGMRCEEGHNAVVHYRRLGGTLGTGHDIGSTLRFTIDYQLEGVDVLERPGAASHLRGTEVVPIDFAIHDGLSFISSLRLGLAHDERDDPALPTQGRYVFVRADVSTTLIGSGYDFVRVQAGWREWFRLPSFRHTLRLGLFVGGAVGDTPFFYRFYVADLSDLIPSRVLELNLDRRAAPNMLDTSVREMRAQELAARLDLEYSLWLYESRDALRGVQLFVLAGAYALMDTEDLRIAIPGYDGFARFPLDLTFDVGLRFDTTVGVFQVGFSTLLGFISL